MSDDYHNYAEQTGHASDCSWVQWVCDGKFYPNPGCSCCQNVPLPPRQPWWKRIAFHAFYIRWLNGQIEDDTERYLLVGLSGGRVSYEPKAEFLYSLRVFLILVKIEILWTT